MTWSELVTRAQLLHERFESDGSLAWYRGHRCADWKLLSTGHRHILRVTDGAQAFETEAEQITLLRSELKTLYRKFQADAWQLLNETERSPWGVLFAMQHFGIPTRLMDWTESFACAVFFAQLNRRRDQDAAIWVLDGQALNHRALGENGLLSLGDDDTQDARVNTRLWHPKWVPDEKAVPTVAAFPVFANSRMVAQRSMFTVFGDTFKPLDEQFGGVLAHDERIVKITLPSELFDDAEEYLASAGLTAFNFYPDLQGLIPNGT